MAISAATNRAAYIRRELCRVLDEVGGVTVVEDYDPASDSTYKRPFVAPIVGIIGDGDGLSERSGAYSNEIRTALAHIVGTAECKTGSGRRNNDAAGGIADRICHALATAEYNELDGDFFEARIISVVPGGVLLPGEGSNASFYVEIVVNYTENFKRL